MPDLLLFSAAMHSDSQHSSVTSYSLPELYLNYRLLKKNLSLDLQRPEQRLPPRHTWQAHVELKVVCYVPIPRYGLTGVGIQSCTKSCMVVVSSIIISIFRIRKMMLRDIK